MMRSRLSVISATIFALVCGIVGFGAVPADQVFAFPRICAKNSTRTSTERWRAYRSTLSKDSRSAGECIANYEADQNRGRIVKHLTDPRARIDGAVYDTSVPQEATAQARLIVRLAGTNGTSVPANIQWETQMPDSKQRLDLMTYDPENEDVAVKVLEIKGSWQGSLKAAQDQAQKYVDQIKSATGRTVELWNLEGYEDTFYRGSPCKKDPSKLDGWKYTVGPVKGYEGVLLVKRERLECEKESSADPTEKEEREKLEDAKDLIAEDEDLPSDFDLSKDRDGNGKPDGEDLLELLLGDDDETLDRSMWPKWFATRFSDKLIREASARAELVLLGRNLNRLEKVISREVLERSLETAFRLAVSSPERISIELFESKMTRLLAGAEISRPLSSVVGKATAQKLKVGAIKGAATKIVEKGGVKMVTTTISEAAAKQFAKILGKYLMRLGITSPVAAIPVVGQALVAALDVWFTIELLLDLAELTGFNVWGDPHLATLDGLYYNLQSAGEFTLLRTGMGAEVQGRFEPLHGSTRVSQTTAIAVSYGGDRVEVQQTGLLVNGQQTSPADGETVVTDGGLAVSKRNGKWIVYTPGGLSVVGRQPSEMRVFGDPAAGATGLLGNNDGDPSNDLVSSQGVAVNAGNHTALHGWFADSWRISQENSSFTYAAGKNTASYTDKQFPSDIAQISDFSAEEIEAATAKCVEAGVEQGATMEACVLDTLVTGNDAFVQAAAATKALVDRAAVSFDENGVFLQTYDGQINSSMAHKTVVAVDQRSRAVGPFFDNQPYDFAVLSMPRHDKVELNLRLIVLGWASVGMGANISVADQPAVRILFDGQGTVTEGADRATIASDGEGLTVNGLPYRAFKVSMQVNHHGDSLKAKIAPQSISSVLGRGLAVDSVELRLDTKPADVASGLVIPFTAGSDVGSGLGVLETAGSEDIYDFELSEETDLLLQPSTGDVRVRLMRDNAVIAPQLGGRELLYRDLAPGSYRLSITSDRGAVESYHVNVIKRPEPQVFEYVVGESVEAGKVGGRPVEGAGRLETSASKDVYEFSVPEGGVTLVVDGDIWLDRSKLVEVSTGREIGRMNGHREYVVSGGRYQVVVEYPGRKMDYWFKTLVKPEAQVFEYVVGESVEAGKVGGRPVEGAGRLETSASKDVYEFSVPEGGVTLVVDGDIWLDRSKLVEVSTGREIGRMNGHREYVVSGGRYQVVVEYPGRKMDYWFRTAIKPM